MTALAALLVVHALQADVDRLMRDKPGTAVVLDARTGTLLAVSNRDVAERRSVHPGSTVKPFTLLAMIESGALGPDTTWFCPNHSRVDGRTLDCTHPVPTSPYRIVDALAFSCNGFVLRYAEEIAPDRLRRALQRFGFTAALARGGAELKLQSVGLWGTEVTPLQLAEAYRRLSRIDARHFPAVTSIREGLAAAVDMGTAQPAGISEVRAAGKTGTSPQAWFAGWGPRDDPSIIVVVYLEQGRGGADAAPIAAEIFRSWNRLSR